MPNQNVQNDLSSEVHQFGNNLELAAQHMVDAIEDHERHNHEYHGNHPTIHHTAEIIQDTASTAIGFARDTASTLTPFFLVRLVESKLSKI